MSNPTTASASREIHNGKVNVVTGLSLVKPLSMGARHAFKRASITVISFQQFGSINRNGPRQWSSSAHQSTFFRKGKVVVPRDYLPSWELKSHFLTRAMALVFKPLHQEYFPGFTFHAALDLPGLHLQSRRARSADFRNWRVDKFVKK
jgi:hypothetical protein